MERHARQLLQDHGVVRRLGGRLAPGERPVTRHQHRRDLQRIERREPPHDRLPRVPLVVRVDLRRRQAPRSPAPPRGSSPRASSPGRGSRGAPAPTPWRAWSACAPRRRDPGTPCTAPGAWAGPTTAAASPSTTRPVQVRDHQVLRRHRFVRHAARLDDHQALVAADAAGIAEGVDDQVAANQFQVRFEDFLAQRFEHVRFSQARAGYGKPRSV